MNDLFNPDAFFRKPASSPRSRQSQLGQFLTPASVATFMASLFDRQGGQDVRLLDAGAGAGALTEAFILHWADLRQPGDRLSAATYEIDDQIRPRLADTIGNLTQIDGVTADIRDGDFIEQAATMIRLERGDRFTHCIINPPYKKISTSSAHRHLLRVAGLETVNLYSGFVGLAVQLLEAGGQIVAIIPRSFCNGPYYEPFRHMILSQAAIVRIHLFDSRNKAFKGDGVLQENVIIHMVKGAAQGDVLVSTSTDDTFSDLTSKAYPFASIVVPSDPAKFIHIPNGEDLLLLRSQAFRFSLDDLGVKVSTGPVVDFRMREFLRAMPEPGTVPLLYPGHFSGSATDWPKEGFKKPNAMLHNVATQKWLYPTGHYAVVRRFSSKEERRRVVANVIDPAVLPYPWIGLENHLNVFHSARQPLAAEMAHGLATYLNSTAVDQYFRQFNGHTQVNATDLRSMLYPDRDTLIALGRWAKDGGDLTQEQIDQKVASLA